MYFGKQPIEKTLKAIVVHSIRLKHQTLKKGHIISAEDIEALKNEGYDSIVVARLEAGDIDENSAAKSLAQAVTNKNLQPDKPFTGRCNIRSNIHGLLRINQAGIDHINRIHESLTIATLPHLNVIKPKQMIATVKIIPFAVESEDLDACIKATQKQDPIIEVLPFNTKRVGFIQTRLPGTKEKILDKTTEVIEQRLQHLQSSIVKELRVKHDETELMEAIKALLNEKVDMLLVIGASAIVDRRDIVPTAIENCGGEIIHFGMPTDPGNLLLLARHGDIPFLGLPGCARSPKRNGLDIVLERLVANVPVTSSDITLMGTGGLLKEIKSRPQPRGG